MTRQGISQMLAAIGLPYAYDHFSAADAPGGPPFICFTLPASADFVADGRVYKKISALAVELYTDDKDPELEDAVEAALSAAGLVCDREETRIESEHMTMVRWTTEVFID